MSLPAVTRSTKLLIFGGAALVCGLLGHWSGWPGVSTPVADAAQPGGRAVASAPAAKYDAQGRLLRPANHHEWIFVGAPVTPNELNDGHAAFPEFHNVYIDPASYESYRKTGEFPQGTVVLKELVSVGGKSLPSGNGYFQGEFKSLEAMVKDSQQFPKEPGGWAFFRFGEFPDYTAAGARMKTADCNACHAGADEDYMFTSTYPVLRLAKLQAEEAHAKPAQSKPAQSKPAQSKPAGSKPAGGKLAASKPAGGKPSGK